MALFVALVALLLGSGPAGATQRSTTPHPGYYEGVDAHGLYVTFTAGHGVVHHFRTSGGAVGRIEVVDGRWQRTCEHHICVRGHWLSPTHAEGTWRHPGGEWVGWSVHDEVLVPATGLYLGPGTVEFRYRHGAIHGLSTAAGGPIPVARDGSFHFCTARDVCVEGHWQSAYWVTGVRLTEGAPHDRSHWWAGFVPPPDHEAGQERRGGSGTNIEVRAAYSG